MCAIITVKLPRVEQLYLVNVSDESKMW